MTDPATEFRAISKLGKGEYYVRKVCRTEGVTLTTSRDNARVFESVEEIQRVCSPWGEFKAVTRARPLTKHELRVLDAHTQRELFA